MSQEKNANNQELLKKRIFLVLAVAVVILIIVFAKPKSNNENLVGTQGQVEEEVVVTSEKMAQPKKYGGFDITDITFRIRKDALVDISAKVTNNTGKDMDGNQYMKINILDREGNILNSCGGLINQMNVGESRMIYSTVPSNGFDKKAYDIEIVDFDTKEEEDSAMKTTKTGK